MKKGKKKPRVLDLFCGAGGLSEGFKQAGYQIILGIDNIETFVKTFKKNHRRAVAICEDIRKISVDEIKENIKNESVDVVAGGPPCQGFSMAGRRDPKDPRNSLFAEFVRIVDGISPKFFVMENVKGILSMTTTRGEPVIDIIKKEFKRIGYEVDCRILLAADYGVPQKRHRVFFIGTNTSRNITFPAATHSKDSQLLMFEEKIKKWVPVKKVLLSKNEVDKIFFHSQRMIDGFKKREEKNKALGNGFGWQILNPNKPSYTISARYWKDGADALVKYSEKKIRMLTPLECARIQSFSDNFKFMGSKREIYIQIGNAVPPLMAKAVAKEIRKSLEKRRK